MTPTELDAWIAWLKTKLPARDSHWWRWSTILGAVVIIAQDPGLLPPGYHLAPEWATWLNRVAALLLGVGAKMASSPAPSPKPLDN